MAVSLNSVVGFNSKVLPPKCQHVLTTLPGASAPQGFQFISSLSVIASDTHKTKRRRSFLLSVADSDRLSTDPSKGRETAENSISGDRHSSVSSSVDANSQLQASNGSTASNAKLDEKASLQSTVRRSPLTARERLKAARVLNRYSETKGKKSEMGSKVLDVLRESERGKKRSGLPEAPTNLFDDSKRGLPKQGWTFQFPGGADLFFIVSSFVFISVVMFATTFVVWKVGAIHFNEY